MTAFEQVVWRQTVWDLLIGPPGAGCRGIASGTPFTGRAVFVKHEWPRRPYLVRLFVGRGRCYCGELHA